MTCPHPELQAGQSCTCGYRKPYPKRESSPQSKTFSDRVPVDEAEAHDEVAKAAAEHLGVLSRPHWRYWLNTYAYARVLQDASLKDVGRGS